MLECLDPTRRLHCRLSVDTAELLSQMNVITLLPIATGRKGFPVHKVIHHFSGYSIL
jgi:hypothetical protein